MHKAPNNQKNAMRLPKQNECPPSASALHAHLQLASQVRDHVRVGTHSLKCSSVQSGLPNFAVSSIDWNSTCNGRDDASSC
jgi:hypothetical protein